MVIIDGVPYSFNRRILRSLITGILAVMGILCGIVPEFSPPNTQLNFNYSAYTQDFNDTQITNYARAVLNMESYRQSAYRRIQQIIGRNPPAITCDRPDTFKSLPKEAQKIAVDYCNRSKSIVENSGLTVAQFNGMTQRLRSDQELKRRIQNAMIRIQRQKK